MEILGKEYKLSIMNCPEETATGPRIAGVMYQSCIIEVCNKNILSEDVYNQSFVHEIIHIIDNSADLEMTEKQVTVLSDLLYTIIKDKNMKDIVKELEQSL